VDREEFKRLYEGKFEPLIKSREEAETILTMRARGYSSDMDGQVIACFHQRGLIYLDHTAVPRLTNDGRKEADRLN